MPNMSLQRVRISYAFLNELILGPFTIKVFYLEFDSWRQKSSNHSIQNRTEN